MIHIFNNIVHSGLSEMDGLQKRRCIVLSNYLSLILSIAIILLLTYRVLILKNVTYEIFTNTFLVGIFVFISPLLLNRVALTNLSRILLCIAPLAFIWYAFISSMLQMERVTDTYYDGMRIYLLALSPIPYLLSSRNNLWLLLLTVLPFLFSFLLFDHILTWAGVGHGQKGTLNDDYPIMQLRSFIAYIIISGACYAFQTIITQNDALNEQILIELKNKSEEIETQNEELIQSQDNLNDLYQNLEKLVANKTEAIQLQNEKILKYSFSNSHLVRASVARVLGLIYLSKLDPASDDAFIFEKIAHEINDLNETTKNITQDLGKDLKPL